MQKQKNKKLQSFTEKEKQMAEEIEHLNLQLKEKKVTAVQHEKESSEWDIRFSNFDHYFPLPKFSIRLYFCYVSIPTVADCKDAHLVNSEQQTLFDKEVYFGVLVIKTSLVWFSLSLLFSCFQ